MVAEKGECGRVMTAEDERAASATGEPLIAKKDVLEQTGISYGQFYRWKRKGLIPESWFIRKSTFTGQETFLPRELILDRIEAIKALKDDHSLEEIAEMLSPSPSKQAFTREELRAGGWFRSDVLDRYRRLTGDAGPYRVRDLFLMELMLALEREAGVDQAAIDRAVATAWQARVDLHSDGPDWTLCLLRTRGGEAVGCLAPGPEVTFDPSVDVRLRIVLQPILERTRRRLSQRPEGR